MPTTHAEREPNAHQKAGLTTFLLISGSRMTTDDIAKVTGMTTQGVDYMMDMLCGVLPIVKVDGRWQWAKFNS